MRANCQRAHNELYIIICCLLELSEKLAEFCFPEGDVT